MYENATLNEHSLYILEHMPVIVDALDYEGNIVIWNKEAERVTGYSKKEIINNKDAFKILYPDDEYRKYVLDSSEKLKNNFRNFETTITCKDGSKKVISWSNISSDYPIEGLSLWAVGIDITKRKTAEENLKVLTSELLSIVKAFPDLYFRITRDTTIVDFKTYNPADLYVKPENIIGNKVTDMLPFEVAILYKSAIEIVLDTKQTKSIEYSLPLENGKQYFEARIVYLNDQETMAVVRNITDKKLMELETLEQRKKYKLFFDLSPDIIIEADMFSGFIFNANSTFLNLTNIKQEQLGTISIYNLFDIYDEIQSEKFIDAIINGSSIKIESKLNCIKNDNIFFELNIIPILNNEILDRVIIFGKNITDSKKLKESEIKIRELEEYEHIRSEFFANISHEFRTPLNIILGSIQLLELYMKNNQVYDNKKMIERYNKSIKQNCFRLIRMVNNLIDITKVNSGYMQLNLKKCNIVSLVEDIVSSVSDYVKYKKLNITFDTNTEEKIICCDDDKIERIILNLLSNAIKFTPNNGDIFVNLIDRGDYIVITVKDTGIGIPHDKQEIIFERFHQVNKSLTRENEGSGIGLSIVKSFVEMHGGEIKVISKEGLGSEFIILLPTNLDKNISDKIDMMENFNKVEKISIEFSDIYL